MNKETPGIDINLETVQTAMKNNFVKTRKMRVENIPATAAQMNTPVGYFNPIDESFSTRAMPSAKHFRID